MGCKQHAAEGNRVGAPARRGVQPTRPTRPAWPAWRVWAALGLLLPGLAGPPAQARPAKTPPRAAQPPARRPSAACKTTERRRVSHNARHLGAVHGTLGRQPDGVRVRVMRSAHLVVDGGRQHRRARVLQTARRCGGSPAPAVHCSVPLSLAYQVGHQLPSAPPHRGPCAVCAAVADAHKRGGHVDCTRIEQRTCRRPALVPWPHPPDLGDADFFLPRTVHGNSS